MGSYRLAFCVLLVLTAIASATAEAAGAFLDQYQETSTGAITVNEGGDRAQTFMPSVSALLDHVDVLIGDQHSPAYPTTVSIVETDSGVPSGATLGSVNVTFPEGGWQSVDFLSANVVLTAETCYGLVLLNDESV